MSRIASICVYCGSRDGVRDDYGQAASALGALIARRGVRLVYGGAQVGLMGAVANAALAAGGEVLGVIPESMMDREIAHVGLSELQVVSGMHARKLAMMDAADAFIALPGGFGTLEELFEVLTWHQLGWHDKPCGLLDVAGFYAPLVNAMAHMRDEGFVSSAHVERIRVANTPVGLLESLHNGA
ncbi:hypothetical protein SADO_08987 [Salinisphaera dokdonensis CL-ES53]|uniref:Cytokinin riboside 5'-monophosphate phosphoribohydrolase n=1 Tax=Salinisphaera dokdonensis CL-ES53 TaxID=1304272 RepID=A0ABV2B0G2_9GAMM